MTIENSSAPTGPLLSVKTAADRLGLSVRTVRRLIADGEIKVVRIGRAVRITPEDLEVAIARWRE